MTALDSTIASNLTDSSEDSTLDDAKPDVDANTSQTMEQALALAEIELDAAIVHQLNQYCLGVWSWNKKLNLTRHDTYDKFVTRDLVDTMQLANLLNEGERILDVGTGAGVPGMVLHFLRPDLDIMVCDSVTKKANAVADIAASLKMKIQVAHARAEEILEVTSFDTVTARAVGSLTKMLKWFEPHWGSIGRLLLIKGPKWVDERGEARHHGLLRKLDLRKVTSYPVPGTEWESVILSLEPKEVP